MTDQPKTPAALSVQPVAPLPPAEEIAERMGDDLMRAIATRYFAQHTAGLGLQRPRIYHATNLQKVLGELYKQLKGGEWSVGGNPSGDSVPVPALIVIIPCDHPEDARKKVEPAFGIFPW